VNLKITITTTTTTITLTLGRHLGRLALERTESRDIWRSPDTANNDPHH